MEAQLACSRNVPLDENHSHFILIDDGSENKFGGEIEFRTSLEKYISEQSVDPDDKESCKWFLCVGPLIHCQCTVNQLLLCDFFSQFTGGKLVHGEKFSCSGCRVHGKNKPETFDEWFTASNICKSQ